MLPRGDSGRLFLSFYWLFVMIAMIIYAGNLVAFLTFPDYETPIDSIQDLMERRDSDNLTWGLPKDNLIGEHVKVKQFEQM